MIYALCICIHRRHHFVQFRHRNYRHRDVSRFHQLLITGFSFRNVSHRFTETDLKPISDLTNGSCPKKETTGIFPDSFSSSFSIKSQPCYVKYHVSCIVCVVLSLMLEHMMESSHNLLPFSILVNGK